MSVASRCFMVLGLMVFARGPAVHAEENRFVTSGTVRARALALGGAYHSVVDDLSAGFYNPAAFRMDAIREERPFRIFFNPVAPGTGLNDFSRYDLDYARDDDLTAGEALRAASYFLKGAALTTPVLDIGFGLNEEMLGGCSADDGAGRAYSLENLVRGSFHSAFANMKIAPAISLGLGGTLYQTRVDGKDRFGSGYSFGVLLEPHDKMNVGIAYNKLPADEQSSRIELEGIEDSAATVGLSYYPGSSTLVSVDIRTVNMEEKPTSREIHAGFEHVFHERIALRGGYYRKKSTNNDVISLGFGYLPRWGKIGKYARSMRADMFSYTFIQEEDAYTRRWHVVSLLLRL